MISISSKIQSYTNSTLENNDLVYGLSLSLVKNTAFHFFHCYVSTSEFLKNSSTHGLGLVSVCAK